MNHLFRIVVFLSLGFLAAKYGGSHISNFASDYTPPDWKSVVSKFKLTDGPTADKATTTVRSVSKAANTNNRSWVFTDGSKLNASLVFADAKQVQLLVTSTQGLGTVELKNFSESDKRFLKSLIRTEGGHSIGNLIPVKTHAWPRNWRNNKSAQASRQGTTNEWQSPNFDITNLANVNEESLQAIVRICESVDGALRALPLPVPLNWGRPDEERRKIIIQPVDKSKHENVAGYWDSRTGNVHIHAEYLLEPDRQAVVFEFDKPEKVQKYDVIVHEVTHQSTAALAYLNMPAWVPEGIAEYLSATQYAPAAYQFTSTHVTVRHHINKLLLADRIVKDRRMNLVHLQTFMNRDIMAWNQTLAKDPIAGPLQYNLSLLLVDYFCHRDHPNGAHFRRYLESVLTGLPEPEARERYLLRGRTYRELEQELHKIWKPIGFTIAFQERSQLSQGDVTIDYAAEEVKRTIAAQRAMKNRKSQ